MPPKVIFKNPHHSANLIFVSEAQTFYQATPTSEPYQVFFVVSYVDPGNHDFEPPTFICRSLEEVWKCHVLELKELAFADPENFQVFWDLTENRGWINGQDPTYGENYIITKACFPHD